MINLNCVCENSNNFENSDDSHKIPKSKQSNSPHNNQRNIHEISNIPDAYEIQQTSKIDMSMGVGLFQIESKRALNPKP
jgi:hypothetical protein